MSEKKTNETTQAAAKTAREILLSSQKPSRAQSEKKNVKIPSQPPQESDNGEPIQPPPKKRMSATARAKAAQEEAKAARKEAKALQERLEALESQKAVIQEESQQQLDLMGEATINTLHSVAFDLLNKYVIAQYPWPQPQDVQEHHRHLNRQGWEFVKWALPDLGEQMNPGVAYAVSMAGFVMANRPSPQAPLDPPKEPPKEAAPPQAEEPPQEAKEPEVSEPRPVPGSSATPLDPLASEAI